MGKVLLFFTSNYPFGTGESFIENEIDYLANAFDKVILISEDCVNPQTRQVPHNVTIIRKNFSLSATEKTKAVFYLFNTIVQDEISEMFTTHFSLKKLRYMLSSFAKGNKIKNLITDIVLTHTPAIDKVFIYSYWWLDASIGIAIYKKKHHHVIAFTRAHGYDLYNFRQANNYLPFRKFTINALNKVFVISHHGKNYLQHYYNLSTEELIKINVSRLGTSNIMQGIKEKDTTAFTLVSCSYIYPNKRVDLIAEALLLIKNIKIHWIHIGDFTNWIDESYRTFINELFLKLKQHPNITVDFKGNLTNNDILKFYSATSVDLFINVSKAEGIPVSIMEALSFSIPVIATNVGGTSEIVNDVNGYLLEENCSNEKIANTIIDYYQLAKAEKQNKCTAAFETWNTNYNAEKNYTKFVNDIITL